MKAIGGPNLFEKQMVTRHRIVNARSGKNQSVVTTKSRNHDRRCHAHRAGMTEDGVHHRHGYPVLRRMLDFRERQHSDVGEIGQQIKNNHDGAANYQRAHQIFSRIAHLRCR